MLAVVPRYTFLEFRSRTTALKHGRPLDVLMGHQHWPRAGGRARRVDLLYFGPRICLGLEKPMIYLAQVDSEATFAPDAMHARLCRWACGTRHGDNWRTTSGRRP